MSNLADLVYTGRLEILNKSAADLLVDTRHLRFKIQNSILSISRMIFQMFLLLKLFFNRLIKMVNLQTRNALHKMSSRLIKLVNLQTMVFTKWVLAEFKILNAALCNVFNFVSIFIFWFLGREAASKKYLLREYTRN